MRKKHNLLNKTFVASKITLSFAVKSNSLTARRASVNIKEEVFLLLKGTRAWRVGTR